MILLFAVLTGILVPALVILKHPSGNYKNMSKSFTMVHMNCM